MLVVWFGNYSAHYANLYVYTCVLPVKYDTNPSMCNCAYSIAVNSAFKLYIHTIHYIQNMYLVLVLLQETITHFDYRLC